MNNLASCWRSDRSKRNPAADLGLLFPNVTHWRRWSALAIAGLAALLLATGCRTNKYPESQSASAAAPPPIILREGDVLKISFPGAPNLNAQKAIRRDGKIDLDLVGECQAAGLTLPALEKQILKLYESQLQTKEVSVTLESTQFPVYVTGAVLKPGKIIADRPLTVLEAVMEAGGFDLKRADVKNIRVLRQENGSTRHFELNLKGVLQGQESEHFMLQPSDMIYVPERFTWF